MSRGRPLATLFPYTALFRSVCDPPSGYGFPKGTTNVVCTATDAVGLTSNCTFSVTITGTERCAPSTPRNSTPTAASGECTQTVRFVATFTDNCAGGSIVCDP